MARTGLRMMPTFPSSPLKFRTVSFPQYGFKVGWSKGAFPASGVQLSRPSGLHPFFVPPAFKPVYPRAVSGQLCACAPPLEHFVLLYPRGPRSGPGYSVPVHQHLIDPIRPAHRHILISPLSGLYEMPSLCIPA